jgi:hypothetical protein
VLAPARIGEFNGIPDLGVPKNCALDRNGNGDRFALKRVFLGAKYPKAASVCRLANFTAAFLLSL